MLRPIAATKGGPPGPEVIYNPSDMRPSSVTPAGRMLRSILLLLMTPAIFRADLFYSQVLDLEEFQKTPKVALIVGVDRHASSGMPDLRYAVADARAMQEALTASGFGYQVRLLLDAKVTRASVLWALHESIASMGGKGTLIVYYSGNGFEDDSGRQYLVTYETDPTRPLGTALPLSIVADALRKSTVPHKLIVVDACRSSGPGPRGHRGLDSPLPDLFYAKTNPTAALANVPGLHILEAASHGQASFEEPQFGHGVFTHFLLEGLRGKAANNGVVTELGLADYSGRNVIAWAREHGHPQTPYEAGKPGEDFVLGGKWIAPTFKAIPNETRALVLKSAAPAPTGAKHDYALVIGIDHYSDPKIGDLLTALNDATGVESLLRGSYGFETQILPYPTRARILGAINQYRKTLGPDDSLLIYYAGHGYFDQDTGKAYWLPSDSQPDDNTNWIDADSVTANLKIMPARHVLIVSDSCYSGTFGGERLAPVSQKSAADSDRERYLSNVDQRKSRLLLASGANEPVLDGGGDGKHSIFASVFLEALEQMPSGKFTAQELFDGYIQERVGGRSKQLPQYSPLRNSGHDGGGFIFDHHQVIH